MPPRQYRGRPSAWAPSRPRPRPQPQSSRASSSASIRPPPSLRSFTAINRNPTSSPAAQPVLSSSLGPSSVASPIIGGAMHVEEDMPEVNDVIMALEMRSNGAVGCAYYVAASETVYLQEDTRITGIEVVESLLLQALPTVIITPSRSPESFVSFLERQSHSEDAEVPEGGQSFILRTMLSSNFNSESGKERLAKLESRRAQEPHAIQFATATEDCFSQYWDDGEQSRGVPHRAYRRNGLMRLGALINLDSRITLGCVNALLCDLERHLDDGSDGGILSRIKSIQMISYKDCMFVTADTMLALQIFRMDGRSNVQRPVSDRRGNDSGKQQAVFDLFRAFTLTPQGHSRLREMFLRPSTDVAIIADRHETISVLLHTDNADTVTSIRAALRKIKGVRSPFQHLRQGALLPGSRGSMRQCAWANLASFCKFAATLSRLVQQLPRHGSNSVAEAFANVPNDELSRLGARVDRTIDFEKSKTIGCVVVADGVSQELDGFRSTHDQLHQRLDEICGVYRSQVPASAGDPIVGCIFHPHIGYLTVAASDPRTLAGPRASFGAWDEALQEDGLIYFRTPEMEGLDGEFGDLAGHIIELEASILHRLRLVFLEHEDEIFYTSEAIGELDCLLALAAGAEKFRLSRPQMTIRNVLDIRAGRHLLQEIGPGSFVPNDCRLAGGLGPGNDASTTEHGQHSELDGPDEPGISITRPPTQAAPSTIVMTGPNQSGKSVYIKQVAIIVYLAHVGSFVPAAGAVIGITDRILSRIATRESVSRDESAFGVDLRQAAFSINFSTWRSLILIDEFGKGTNEIDGAALFHALIDHFLALGARNAPKVLAATHFHEIFDSKGLREHPQLGVAHMSVSIDPRAVQSEDKVRFLYTLQGGHSRESFGCHCAAINGVDAAVVDRANRIAESLAHGGQLERVCLELSATEIGQLQDNESRARAFVGEMEDEEVARQKWPRPRDLLTNVLSD